ncbi:AEC family transporter [Agathobaculum sp. Marseille-P7918]|uniref:AEC family transporter n=1 Tax=Agathobaculum sp. Marseille-P7918 TaxID=2479843 RepID=UPI000F644309|nr:AEC family transporter [Agathobaculum sp. Marseille-P7918]
MVTQILIQQTIIMFLLMLLGLLLSRLGAITEQGSKDMANILLYAVIPCVIVRSYITEYSTQKLYALGISAVIAVVAFIVTIAVAWIAFGMRHRIENFSTAFGNAGFIGIPLVTSVFGAEAAFYVVAFSSMLNLLQWTYGIVIISGNPKTINVKKVFINPVFISMMVGLVLFLTGFTLPAIVGNTIGLIADANTPLAMLVLGFYLSQVKPRELFCGAKLYLVAALRLFVIPLLTALAFLPMPFARGEVALITLVAAATPVATSTGIFAQKFGQDYRSAVTQVCFSTIVSVVSIPIVIWIAERLLA